MGESDQRSAAPSHATGAVRFVDLDAIGPDETFRLRPDGDLALLATSVGRLGQLAPVELRPWAGRGSDGPRWQVVSGFRRLAAVRLLARERILARLHEDLSDDDAWGIALCEALLREPFTAEELSALRERLRAQGVAPWAEELVDEALVRAPVAPELREAFYEFLREQGAPGAGAPSRAPVPGARVEGGTEGEPGAPRGAAEQAPSAAQASTTEVPAAEPARAEGSPEPGASPRPEDVVEVTPEELVQDLAARLSALNQDLATAVEAWLDLPAEGRRLIREQARYVEALLPFMEIEG